MTCLRCRGEFDEQLAECPHCGEKVTDFQRTYNGRLLDGKYEILFRLGLGGMGEIFKVRHVHLGEERVVKIMRPNIATDDDSLKRFLHEARLATMVKHRNLAMLYDFATLEDGSYYMVWEFIDGSNVQKWITQNGPMPPRIVVEISVQALAGLQALHQMGVIHRDISPENIMITQDFHEKLLSKVIDFGIAKQLSEGEGGQGLTQTGMFLGKLKYASPEQAGFLKEGEQLDARSDIYSYGILMYEMLAGRAPFVSTNPQSYILKHATEKPLPISELNPNVKVPPKLEAIIFKTLEKDRNKRHASAADLIADLEAIREEIPPDEVHGVGEKLVTISQARTMADLSAPMVTGKTLKKKTVQARRTPGPGESTVIEKTGSAGTMSGDPTVVERAGGPSTMSGDATVVERQGSPPSAATGPAPTVVERQYGGEASTVIEPIGVRPQKSRLGLTIGIAAVLILALGAGWWFTRDTAGPGEQAGDVVDVVPDPSAPGRLAPGEGALLLSANRGELQRVINARTNEEVSIDLADRSLPLRLHLDAGMYELTMVDGNGESSTQTATVVEGQEVPVRPQFQRPDLDNIIEDILEP
ncbi:MAG: protein kinase [Acidobacteria bacterium]|nr:protein kinase [Acidobacteriota bacterium]